MAARAGPGTATARLLCLLHHLTGYIVYFQAYWSGLRQTILYRGTRIEGIGEILSQFICLGHGPTYLLPHKYLIHARFQGQVPLPF